jgi:hypothetical protein
MATAGKMSRKSLTADAYCRSFFQLATSTPTSPIFCFRPISTLSVLVYTEQSISNVNVTTAH